MKKKFIIIITIALVLFLIPSLKGYANEEPSVVANDFIVEVGQKVDYLDYIYPSGGITKDQIRVDSNHVDLKNPGIYFVYYYVSLSDETTIVKAVRVVVLAPIKEVEIKPEILNAKDFEVVKGAERNLFQRVKAKIGDKDVTNQLLIDDSHVNFDVAGNYPLFYYISDNNGQVVFKRVIVTIIIEDTEPPVLEGLLESYKHTVNSKKPTWGSVTAYDLVSGDLTKAIYIDDSKVKYNELGTYQVTFSVEDDAGNKTTQVVEFIVLDDVAPKIEMSQYLNFAIGSSPQMKEYFTITDNFDKREDITVQYNVDDVDFQKPGVYDMTVKATDKNNNTKEEIFQVYVYDDSEIDLLKDPFILGALVAVVSTILINIVLFLFAKSKR